MNVIFKKMLLVKINMVYCLVLLLNFFLYYMYYCSIYLLFNLCIKDIDFDIFLKQGYINRYMYVLFIDKFLKIVLWFYCDN